MRKLSLFLLVCLLANVNGELYGQKITSNASQTANSPVTFNINLGNVPGIPPMYPLHSPPVWYKTFWIFSDGNFMEDTTTSGAVSSRTYQFEAPGQHWTTAFLMEAYTNLDAPDTAGMVVTTGGSGTAGAGTVQQMPLNEAGNLNIFLHQKPKPNYPVAFALSYLHGTGGITEDRRDEESKETGKGKEKMQVIDTTNLRKGLFFFYNHKRSGMIRAFEKRTHVLPNYFTSSSAVVEASTPTFTSTSLPASLKREFTAVMSDSFENYFYYPLAAMNSPSTILRNGFSRKRVFPVLTTRQDSLLINKNATVLAMTIGDIPNNLSTQEQALVAKYFSAIGSEIAPGSYITGIAETSPHVVSSHDPNKLQVMRVCVEDSFKVITMRLTMCNTGNERSGGQEITLTDLTGGKLFGVAANLPISEHELRNSTVTANAWLLNTRLEIKAYNKNDAVHDNCEWVEFSLNVPLDFVSTQPIVEACVRFIGANFVCRPEDCCSKNEPVAGNFLIPFECGCDWMKILCISGIVLLVILVGYLFWRYFRGQNV